MTTMARIYRSTVYRAAVPRLMRLFTPVQVGLYRLFRGRVVGRMATGFMPVLLLTTVGRKSGRLRTRPVGYVRHASSLLIVGSNSGLTSDPGWIYNLRARPEADVELDASDRMGQLSVEHRRGPPGPRGCQHARPRSFG